MSDDAPKKPTPPMGSQTAMAQKIGEAFAREMAKHGVPRAEDIPAHRWSEKLARFGHRVVFVALAVAAWKLVWPWYIVAASSLMAVRALSPELADANVKWVLSVARGALGLKNGNGGNGSPPSTVGPAGQ